MADSTLWWIAFGLLLGTELLTTTFYLLMVALGAAAGALVAYAGLPPGGQIATAALVGLVAVLAAYFAKRRRPGDPSPRAERSVNLDIGETIQVDNWNADGTALTHYRGAQWTAQLRPGAPQRSGAHRVVELVGNRLLVEPA